MRKGGGRIPVGTVLNALDFPARGGIVGAATSIHSVIVVVFFLAAAVSLVQVARKPQVRERLAAHWWIWLAIALVAITGNELYDRLVWNEAHPLGDFLAAVVAVAIVFFVSARVASRGS